jgi:hypothetical protein
MDNQIEKVCKHEPGKKWEKGCCSPNPTFDNTARKSVDQVMVESASEASFTAQTEAQKHSGDAAALYEGVLSYR